jgi:hypothetical protein
MSWLSERELAQCSTPSRCRRCRSRRGRCRPTSSCRRRNRREREFEAHVQQLGAELAKKQGVSRRRFFQTPAAMAAAFLALNDTFGPLFGVSRAEAATPERANERAAALSSQFIMDMHTHFLRPGTRIMGFVAQRNAVGKAGWNP